MQVLKKKKSSEGFQNIIYSIWFTTYMFVLQKKSVLLKADTFKKYSVNNKQRNNAFVYWPLSTGLGTSSVRRVGGRNPKSQI